MGCTGQKVQIILPRIVELDWVKEKQQNYCSLITAI